MGRYDLLPLEAELQSLLQPRRLNPLSPQQVAALMDGLAPSPTGRAGDHSLARQQLSAAYLAGVAEAQAGLLLKPRLSYVQAAIQEGRTLLKNRAASQDWRLWHAYTAGARAARVGADLPGHLPGHPPAAPLQRERLKLFVRQPFTESDERHRALISEVLQRIHAHDRAPHAFDCLTGREAHSAETFRRSFEEETGRAFTPHAFRTHRLGLLAQADAFVNIRVGMSESSAFELCWHVFGGARTPVLFLVWKNAPIKTTLLKDLDRLCDVSYLEFERAEDLDEGLAAFFGRLAR